MNLDLLNVKPVVTFTYRLTKDDIVKLFQEQLKEQLGDVPLQGDVKLDGEAVVVTLSIAEPAQNAAPAEPAQSGTTAQSEAPAQSEAFSAPAQVDTSEAQRDPEPVTTWESLRLEEKESDELKADFEPMQLGLDSSFDDDEF